MTCIVAISPNNKKAITDAIAGCMQPMIATDFAPNDRMPVAISECGNAVKNTPNSSHLSQSLEAAVCKDDRSLRYNENGSASRPMTST